MKEINNGGPAYPSDISNDPTILRVGLHQGMSLRDYFANSILNGICSNQFYMSAILKDFKLSDEKMKFKIAEICYEQADAMLKQREVSDD